MNVSETEQNSLNENCDGDDDAEEYFLQATPGAYDIKEKIRAANDELFEDFESYNNAPREHRVTFKEDLVDYEPDYSSDDGYVQSPDALSLSDNENDHIYEHTERHSLECISEVPTQESFESEEENEKYDSGKCDINNDSEKCEIDSSLNNIHEESQGGVEMVNEKCDASEVVVEEEEENIVEEEIVTDNSEQSDQLKTERDDRSSEEDPSGDEDILDEDKSIEVIEIINDTDDDVEDDDVSETVSTMNGEEDNTTDVLASKTSKLCSSKIDKVNCRVHCLEKKDLDRITGGSRALVHVTTKGPALKLRQRPCCTNQNAKPRLPVYNGLISEYGLTKAQLERRKRRKETGQQRKRDKSNRVKEERRQKEMFNEEIFCAWLKAVRHRSAGSNDKENRKTKRGTWQRPSTCNIGSCCVKKEQVRRRPSTSPCKSYTTILVTPSMTIKEVIMYKKKRI